MNKTFIICPNCKEDNRESAKFCAYCGSKIKTEAPKEKEPAAKFCPKCGAPTSGKKFCGKCGAPLTAVTEPEIKEPEIKEPEIKEPEIKEPEIKEPEIKEPEIKEPEIKVFICNYCGTEKSSYEEPCPLCKLQPTFIRRKRKKCPSCGLELPVDTKDTCVYCGASLEK